ncbi:MAG: phosphoribosylglycinamide formyltransferase [Desulfitobacteriaceae bacterium]
MRTAILASGRGSNLQAIVKEWQNGHLPIDIVAVGSDQPDALALKYAQKAGISVKVFSKAEYSDRASQEEGLLSWFKESKVELLLLAGYMKVLSENFIDKVEFPILNIHPSLLPAFSGLHAQRQALEYGVKFSGCTVHYVDKGLDSGPIILQEAVQVLADDTEATLAERILEVEHQLYPRAVKLVAGDKLERKGRRVLIKAGG